MAPLAHSGFLLLTLLAAGSARAAEIKDLSGQFPDAACRKQAGIGACHAFAAVAVLEAAIFRRHGAAGTGGAKLALSEGDLFVRRTVAGVEYFSKIKSALDEKPDISYAVHKAEAGKSDEDVEFAVAHGIATAETVPFELIEERYAAFTKRAERLIARQLQACKVWFPGDFAKIVDAGTFAVQAKEQADQDLAKFDEDVASGYSDTLSGLRGAQLQHAETQCKKAQLETQPVLSLSQYLEQAAGKNTKAAEKFLLGDIPKLDEERAWVKGLLAGFAMDAQPYPLTAQTTRDDLAACRSGGKTQRQYLLKRLRQGIPVAASMDLAGLTEWNKAGATKSAWHAFVVTGFELDGDKLTLRTRNSWGGKNPDIPDDRFCRFRHLAVLLSDKEK